jgi:hypothetical protein
MAIDTITQQELTVALNANGIDSRVARSDFALSEALFSWIEANRGHHPSLPPEIAPKLPVDVQQKLDKLEALEAGGVDNWEWYDASLEGWYEQYKGS